MDARSRREPPLNHPKASRSSRVSKRGDPSNAEWVELFDDFLPWTPARKCLTSLSEARSSYRGGGRRHQRFEADQSSLAAATVGVRGANRRAMSAGGMLMGAALTRNASVEQ
jgi:hypothetical protein